MAGSLDLMAHTHLSRTQDVNRRSGCDDRQAAHIGGWDLNAKGGKLQYCYSEAGVHTSSPNPRVRCVHE
jgi:hypothetical protein